jgi:hypothetical protein
MTAVSFGSTCYNAPLVTLSRQAKHYGSLPHETRSLENDSALTLGRVVRADLNIDGG